MMDLVWCMPEDEKKVAEKLFSQQLYARVFIDKYRKLIFKDFCIG